MFSTKRKISHTTILVRNKSFIDTDRDNRGSRVILYLSQMILLLGFLVIAVDALDILSPGRYIGMETISTYLVFLAGFLMSFFSVPFLYWSSYNKFENNDNFWDKETFWILPIFFFGSFFQYISYLQAAYIFIPASMLLCFIVHINVMLSARNVCEIGEEEGKVRSYMENLIYLTAYYLISLVIVIVFDVFNTFKTWIY